MLGAEDPAELGTDKRLSSGMVLQSSLLVVKVFYVLGVGGLG